MDLPASGRVHVGTVMDSLAPTACWFSATMGGLWPACWASADVGIGQISGGQRDGQGKNIMQAVLSIGHRS